MARQTLDSLTDTVFADVNASLGDPIQYSVDGTSYVNVMAWVDYREKARDLGIGVIEQDILIEILRSDVPTRPAPVHRILLPKLAGRVFRPNSDASVDAAGRNWIFSVKEVK